MDTSTTSSIISTLGGGSGVDMVKLAGDLAEARFLPQVAQLDKRSEALEAKISGASTLKNLLSQFSSALGDRIRSGDLAPEPKIGDLGVASVSVLTGSNAKGSYSLEVSRLATAQVLASNAYSAGSDLVGEGQLTLRFGAIAGSAFTDGGQDPLVLDIAATDTLADVATAIRGSGRGLNAYVADTASGTRLVIKGEDGESRSFTIEATGASSSGGTPAPGQIDYLAWNPASDSGQLKASAGNAAFLFDGVAMTSETNKVTGLPNGLVLNLSGTNEGSPTAITFGDKTAQITSMMGDFVGALNDIAGSLAEIAAPLGGDLSNDPGARALRRALSSLASEIVMPNAAPGEPATLGDLGLVRGRDGSFSLDTKRLDSTLDNNPAAARAMFTTGPFGVFATIDKLSRAMGSRADPGTLGGSITRYTSQLEQLEDRREKIADQQEALRERMVKTFAASDARVAASQSTLQFLKNQIAAWNSNNN
ncbi:flagellar filament capping protein FliD [Aurantiacibacter poecillastricola]|uniref:flagellar filament capping protein FliD n=1 Tax=Aurantiacibacter poecillastricola TaxID=3064385 RepID=UPI00273FD2E6|nr:flagellar filament capping protein FliD [Aurantiacibacter sp. 219JJ12-13]MDP5263139.1 flagellar filament capping protein FliD [Aurantiacibacter sp. 219JJ12-13]